MVNSLCRSLRSVKLNLEYDPKLEESGDMDSEAEEQLLSGGDTTLTPTDLN